LSIVEAQLTYEMRLPARIAILTGQVTMAGQADEKHKHQAERILQNVNDLAFGEPDNEPADNVRVVPQGVIDFARANRMNISDAVAMWKCGKIII
jgi:hypothetical protein